MSANLFYADLYNGKACRSTSGEEMAFSEWTAGGSVSFAIRFLDYVGGYFEKDFDIASLRVSCGPIDARPTGGQFKIKLGSAGASAANTTGFLDWNAGARQIELALNALSGRPGDFSCDDVPGGILIRRVDGVAAVLTVVSNRLVPRSFGRIFGTRVDGEWVYDLRLTQAPLSFSDSAVRIVPEAPWIETIQDGGTDPSGTTIWNEIQALHVPPTFRGTYQLRRGYGKTDLLDPEDGVTQLKDALDAILAPEAGTVTVTNPTTGIAHIEFGGELKGTNIDPLQVLVFSAPPGDWTFTLPLDRSEIREALRGADSITVPFEAEADFYLDSNDHAAGTVRRKLWNTTVKIKRPLIWPDMAEVPSVDWLWPNPQDYVPFSRDSVITGQQHFTTTIGNGIATTIAVAHGLGTESLAGVLLRENFSGGRVLDPDEYSVTVTNADSIEITFPTPPGENAIAVTITSAGPKSAFLNHTHTISEVEDLGGVLDNFGQRIERLEALIGRSDVIVVASGNAKPEYSLPPVGEVLPDIANEDSAATVASQVVAPQGTVVAIGGTELEERNAKAKAELAAATAELEAIKKAREDAAKAAAEDAAKAVVIEKTTIARISFPAASSVWPALRNGGRMPWLLPAIHDAVATNAAVMPALSGSAGNLYSATAAIILPAGSGRKAQSIGPGDKFASDGRCFYRAVRSSATDSWHALEMERELLRAVIREDQFPASSELALGWNLTASLLTNQFDAGARDIARVVDGAQFLLVAEAIPIPDATSPGTPGPNLGAEGTAVVLAAARISLSPATEEHSFLMRLKRDAAGAGTGTVSRYGVAAETPALPGGPFVLRVRLTAFDVDDTSTDPRGQVSISMPASQLSITSCS